MLKCYLKYVELAARSEVMYMLVGVLVEVVQARHVPSCSILFSMDCSQLQPLEVRVKPFPYSVLLNLLSTSKQAAKLPMRIVYGV